VSGLVLFVGAIAVTVLHAVLVAAWFRRRDARRARFRPPGEPPADYSI